MTGCMSHRKIAVNYVVTQPPIVSVPVAETDQHFPVRRIYCVGRNYVEHA